MYRLQDAPEAAPDKYGASPAALSDLWRRVFLRGNQAKTEPAFDARSLENQGERAVFLEPRPFPAADDAA